MAKTIEHGAYREKQKGKGGRHGAEGKGHGGRVLVVRREGIQEQGSDG
jgi:hypothetical protein